jgi:pimeloyl-ACP methyl ester carboxylesterase
MTVVELPFITWGSPTAERHALLVHGLGSDMHTMWRIGEHLASDGWFAVAVDQRGHGTAPRTDRYRIEDYARDLLAVRREHPWDVVIGHSIGGANIVRASAIEPDWARRLVLIDPALATTSEDRAEIRTRQVHNNHTLTVEQQAADNPHWDQRDIETSVSAQRSADKFALVRSCDDNPDWDVLDETIALTVPTLVFQGDPAVIARYTDAHAGQIESANPLVTRVTIPGTGHNVHRDAPDLFCAELSDWLND